MALLASLRTVIAMPAVRILTCASITPPCAEAGVSRIDACSGNFNIRQPAPAAQGRQPAALAQARQLATDATGPSLPRELLSELKQINAKVSELKDAQASLAHRQALQRRAQLLQWAIRHCERRGDAVRGSFDYFIPPGDVPESSSTVQGARRNSGALLPDLLYTFMQGRWIAVEGYILTEETQELTWGEFMSIPGVKQYAAAAFNTALCDQLHALIGERPTVEETGSGGYRMFLN